MKHKYFGLIHKESKKLVGFDLEVTPCDLCGSHSMYSLSNYSEKKWMVGSFEEANAVRLSGGKNGKSHKIQSYDAPFNYYDPEELEVVELTLVPVKQ